MVLDTSLLNTQHYKVCIKGKVSYIIYIMFVCLIYIESTEIKALLSPAPVAMEKELNLMKPILPKVKILSLSLFD